MSIPVNNRFAFLNSRNKKSPEKKTKKEPKVIHPSIRDHLNKLNSYRPFLIKGAYRPEKNGNVCDNHCIHIRTDCCTSHQIKNSIDTALTALKEICPDLDLDYTLNVVVDHTAKYIGRSFVYFTDPRIYNAFLGYNLDGSKRAEEVDDPDWIPPPPSVTEGKRTWAEDAEEEDRMIRPKILIEKEPLVRLPHATDLTKEQKERFQNTSYEFQISPAFITPGVKEGFSPNVLRVKPIPDFLRGKERDTLFEIFTKYAHHQDVHRKFPEIRVFPGNSPFALITYGCHEDTQFARIMQKKTYIENPKTKEITVMNCQHARELSRNY